MSGGSWDYEYARLFELADSLKHQKCPYRRAMEEPVRLLAQAMHDIEWVDSHDLGKGEDLKAIKAFLGEDSQSDRNRQVVKEDKQVIEKLKQFGIES